MYQSVNEISSFDTPAIWHISLLDLYLFGKDVLSDLLSTSSSVWAPAKHAFISDDTHSKVVDCHSVRLLAHYFGSHVSWSTGCILRVIWIPDPSNSQVCNFEETILVKDKIFRFDISMKDTFLMKVLKRQQHASYEESSLFLAELSVLGQMIPEITTGHKIYNKV